MKKHSVNTVANWFIQTAIDENKPVDQIKLMKLVYIAYGVNLAINDKPLFVEPIEAWKYGPVIAKLYQQLKCFGIGDIKYLIALPRSDNTEKGIDKDTINILKLVWKSFNKYSGIQLSNWSHNEDGPWYKAWHHNGGKDRSHYPIEDKIMKDYFKKMVKKK